METIAARVRCSYNAVSKILKETCSVDDETTFW